LKRKEKKKIPGKKGQGRENAKPAAQNDAAALPMKVKKRRRGNLSLGRAGDYFDWDLGGGLMWSGLADEPHGGQVTPPMPPNKTTKRIPSARKVRSPEKQKTRQRPERIQIEKTRSGNQGREWTVPKATSEGHLLHLDQVKNREGKRRHPSWQQRPPREDGHNSGIDMNKLGQSENSKGGGGGHFLSTK